MGFMNRNDPLRINHRFTYLPLRDPRIQPAEIIETMPSIKQNEAGEEFLRKYLAIVRTRLPRQLVEDWFEGLSGTLDDFIHLATEESEASDFLGFMVQGFAMSACEDSYFEISKQDKMSECAWEAMRSMTVHQSITGESFRGQSCLNALLSGYFLAKEFRKNNPQ